MAWFSWKVWRLAYSPNHKASHVVEGNNRWKRIIGGFFWRYDISKGSTKE
jgi:hypothetical protein